MAAHTRSAVLGCILLLLAGCAVSPPPSTALLPPGAFGGNASNQMMAINTAQWAFADPARTRGSLVNGTRAVLAIEYLAGELSTNPRWQYMSGLTKLEMLKAREEVRSLIGVAPNAPSQAVANALVALSMQPTEATAERVIRAPLFTLSPAATVSRLENLPYLPIANRASQRAGAQKFPTGGSGCFVCG